VSSEAVSEEVERLIVYAEPAGGLVTESTRRETGVEAPMSTGVVTVASLSVLDPAPEAVVTVLEPVCAPPTVIR
jgi:hypothetical protein